MYRQMHVVRSATTGLADFYTDRPLLGGQGLEPQLKQLMEKQSAQMKALKEEAEAAAASGAAAAREQAAVQLQLARQEWEAQRQSADERWRYEWQQRLLDAAERCDRNPPQSPLATLVMRLTDRMTCASALGQLRCRTRCPDALSLAL
jgi:hypothetical protein